MKRIIMKNRKGFTLAELLVVVAIIGVLVAIAIPIFSAQLEKTREATDSANIRSAYAKISVDAITGDAEGEVEQVKLVQKETGWQTDGRKATLESLGTVTGEPQEDGVCEVSWDKDSQRVLFNFTGSRIAFPDKVTNPQGFSRAYADLCDKYIRDGIIPETKLKSRMQDYNGHKIVNVMAGEGNFGPYLLDQAKKEKYGDEVIEFLSSTKSNNDTAYFDENLKLIGFKYSVNEPMDGMPSRTASYTYVRDAEGNLILRDAQNAINDAIAKQAIADTYWPTTGTE